MADKVEKLIAKDITSSVTISSSYESNSDAPFHAYELNGMIFFTGEIAPKNGTIPAGWQTILTMSSPYLSKNRTSATGFLYGSVNSYKKAVRLDIFTTGEIKVWASGGDTSDVYRIGFSMSFLHA